MADIQEYTKNPIKRNIISLLMTNKTLRYSDLMPIDADNVLFNYHLQHLVKQGILIKDDNFYSLSTQGIKLTENITESGLFFPKFTCHYKLYLIDNERILMQHCEHRPWFGDTTPLSSKVLYGTGTEERANVRMEEKAGIKTSMKWIGTIRTIALNEKKDIIDDSIYFVCFATSYTGDLKEHDDSNHPLAWHSFDEAIKLEKQNKSSGEKSVEILERLKVKNYMPFAFEEIIKAKSASKTT